MAIARVDNVASRYRVRARNAHVAATRTLAHTAPTEKRGSTATHKCYYNSIL